MPTQSINTQFQIPGNQGGFNAYRPDADDPQYAAQISAKLQLQQVYHTDVQSAWAPDVAQAVPVEHPTFSQIEPFLHHVGDWLDFDRKEVSNHGWIS